MTNSPVPRSRLEQDRARLNELLGRAYVDGQLDLVDYRELQDELFGARTVGELARVGERLPAQYRFGDPAGSDNGVDLAPGQVNDPSLRTGGGLAPGLRLGIGIGFGAAVLVIVVLLVALL